MSLSPLETNQRAIEDRALTFGNVRFSLVILSVFLSSTPSRQRQLGTEDARDCVTRAVRRGILRWSQIPTEAITPPWDPRRRRPFERYLLTATTSAEHSERCRDRRFAGRQSNDGQEWPTADPGMRRLRVRAGQCGADDGNRTRVFSLGSRFEASRGVYARLSMPNDLGRGVHRCPW
jgi:hypothetical protein